MSDIKVSIIVCTYNRCEILKYCLDSLEKQSCDKSHYEVIVVDNNSTDNTKEVVEEYCGRNSNFRYVFEENQGLSHARNRGAKEAKAGWVGYLDDDGKVRENYIEQALFTIENFDFDCFGGKVVNWFKYGKPRWYPEIFYPEMERYNKVCEYDGFICGGISFFKKMIINNIGFPDELGMKGNLIGIGEETWIQIKIRDSGGKIGLNPDIVLEHLVIEKKMKVLYHLKRKFHEGRNEKSIFGENEYKVSTSKLYMVKVVFQNIFNNLKKLKKHNYYIENYLLDVFLDLFYIIGKRYKQTHKEN
jgi:glycosyltransferase involved in cell wall biosynthesis